MGYELQAAVRPALDPAFLRTALKDTFASLGYAIVRCEKHGFGGTFLVRESAEWNEDFFVGVGTDLSGAASGTAAEISAAKSGTVIYLLFHRGMEDASVVAQISEIVKSLGSEALWGEI